MATENGFISRAAELDFAVTKMDGKARADMLGIKRVHYVDADKAKKWHDGLMSEMEGSSEQAKLSLTHIYHRMTGHNEPAPAETLLVISEDKKGTCHVLADGKGGSYDVRPQVTGFIDKS